MSSYEPRFGKYRGVVVNNVDPTYCGRITVKVPDVYGELPSGWAMPCAPVSGPSAGMCMVPAIGASVWVEFEQGNPNKPIWSGCFWELSAQVPTEAFKPLPTNFVLKTVGKSLISIDDSTMTMKFKTVNGNEISITPVGISMKTSTGASLSIAASGITMQVSPTGPKLSMTPTTVELTTGLPPPAGSSVVLQGPQVSINGESFKVIG
jgi:hypothetical protein